jgi:hypothetical protein
MICDHLTTLLGFDCHALDAGGEVSLISTPFRFADGDAVPVFVQVRNGQVRFFDDGQAVMHFIGRGVRLENRKHARFISTAADAHGTAFSEDGDIEAWAPLAEAPSAFSRYIGTMLELCRWEKDQDGVSGDLSLLVDEVASALMAWKPEALLDLGPSFTGISGKTHKLDFLFDGTGVAVANPHVNSASAVLRRLVDIHGAHANDTLPLMVVIDDRADPEGAKREALILQSVAKVWTLGALERQAQHSAQSLQ